MKKLRNSKRNGKGRERRKRKGKRRTGYGTIIGRTRTRREG